MHVFRHIEKCIEKENNSEGMEVEERGQCEDTQWRSKTEVAGVAEHNHWEDRAAAGD